MVQSAIRAFPVAFFVLVFSTAARGQAENPAAARQSEKSPRLDRYGDPLPDGALARFGTIRFRSSSGLSFAVLSPDGRLVAINGGTDSVRLMDSTTGLIARQIPLLQPVGALTAAFSPDGTLLATTNLMGTIEVHDVASGRLIQSLQTGRISSQAAPVFSGDGRLIGQVYEDHRAPSEVQIWEVASGRALAKCKVHANMNTGMALSPDGKIVAAGGMHFDLGLRENRVRFSKEAKREKSQVTVQLWDTRSGQELPALQMKGQLRGVSGVTFAPGGKSIAVAAHKGVTVLLNVADGKEIRRFGTPPAALSSLVILPSMDKVVLRYSPDGKRLAVGGEGVTVWETTTGKRLSTQSGPSQEVRSLVFAGDQVLACAMTGHAVLVWDAQSGKLRGPSDAPTSRVTSITLSADAHRIFVADAAGRLSTYEVPSAQCLRTEALVREIRVVSHGAPGIDLFGAGSVLSAHGKYAALASGDGVRLRDLDAGRDVAEMPVMAILGGVCAGYSPDGKHIAVGGRNFDIRADVSGMAHRLFGSPDADVTDLVEIRDTETGKVVHQFKALKGMPQAVALSADARLVAASELAGDRLTGQKGQIHIWDVASGRQVALIATSLGMTGIGFGGPVVFSPDGTLLAVVDEPNLICLYEAATGKKVAVLAGHAGGRPGALAFSPDGRVLAVGSGNTFRMPFAPTQESESVELWELCSRSIRRELAARSGGVTAIAFSDDGRLLASGGADSTTLLWDVTGQILHPPSPARLSATDAAALWRQLGSKSAADAYQAILRLSSAPEAALALLNKTLKPAAAGPDSKELKRLARQLDSQRFTERAGAAAKLKAAGKDALPVLQEVLKETSSADVRQRVQQLVEELRAPSLSGGDVQSARALEVLENIKTPAARELLQKLAQGRPDAALTRAAKATLARLCAAH